MMAHYGDQLCYGEWSAGESMTRALAAMVGPETAERSALHWNRALSESAPEKQPKLAGRLVE